MGNLIFYIAGIIFGVFMIINAFFGYFELKKFIIYVRRNNNIKKQVTLLHRKKVVNYLLFIDGFLLILTGVIAILYHFDNSLDNIYLGIFVLLLLVYIVVYSLYGEKKTKK